MALFGVDKIYLTDFAFADVSEDVTAVTSGYRTYGGESGSVQTALDGVDTIYSTARAFAAVLRVGTVVIWTSQGGLSSTLVGVDEILSTFYSFVVFSTNEGDLDDVMT